jgi:hypothetical protein
VLGSGVALALGRAFEWELVDRLTIFLWMPVLALVWLLWAATTVWSLIYAFLNRKNGLAALVPVVMAALFVGLATTVPFTDLWLDWNFETKRQAREAVVARVVAGDLVPNVPNNNKLIALTGSPGLSKGGDEIIVQGAGGSSYIFFYTFRGILDNYSGFLWVPSEGTPRAYMDADEPGTQIEKLSENWYFIGHR